MAILRSAYGKMHLKTNTFCSTQKNLGSPGLLPPTNSVDASSGDQRKRFCSSMRAFTAQTCYFCCFLTANTEEKLGYMCSKGGGRLLVTPDAVPTCMTLPTITLSTISGDTLPAERAARAAISLRSVAVKSLSKPPKAPNGVLLAETMNTPGKWRKKGEGSLKFRMTRKKRYWLLPHY